MPELDGIDRQRFRKIVAEQLHVDLSRVVDSAHLIDDLNADSLDLAELHLALEETTNTMISDEAVEKISTVGEAWAFLNNALPNHEGRSPAPPSAGSVSQV